ncbi:hypothetical protein M3Y99_01131900 [Aphelenchoides fujianensis]|nr:hypothetical protein M3Y99_01131900 [Aphelenchoides fujianensis]
MADESPSPSTSRRTADRRRSSNTARLAFRRAASTTTETGAVEFDMDALRKEERAIRSFTESVEFDLPPAAELPAALDAEQAEERSYGMRESSTADTIIEVAKLAAEADALAAAAADGFDRTLGETQKYRMAVGGPEQVDQEFEMHKSLLKEADEEPPAFADPPMARPADLRGRSTSTTSAAYVDPDHQALRRQYSQSAVQRPRPTTPTSWSAIDEFVQQQERGHAEPPSGQKRHLKDGGPPPAYSKIRVSIPTDRERRRSGNAADGGRRNSMKWSDFYETMGQSGKHSRSGSVQALDLDDEWARAEAPPAADWGAKVDANANRMKSDESPTEAPADRRESNAAEERAEENATSSPTEQPEGGVKPVRVAPPPPPPKKKAEDEAPAAPVEDPAAYTGYGDQSEYYQGYGGEAYGAVGYDANSSTAPAYDYSAYGNAYTSGAAYGTDYQTTSDQYDSNAYNSAAYSTGYDQYYQGYDYSTSGQTGTYDYAAPAAAGTDGQAAYDYSAYSTADPSVAAGGYEAYTSGTYDPTTYNAGYDQYGLQTGVVGAEDTAGSSADVSPRPADPTQDEEGAAADPAAASYDYSQYSAYGNTPAYGDYSATSADPSAFYSSPPEGTNVTVNEPSGQFATAADYAAYGTTDGSSDYTSQYGAPVEAEAAPVDPTTAMYGAPAEPMPAGGLQPFSTPLLPQQRARTPDPFSWEAQETQVEQTGVAQPPPPRPPPAAARTSEVESEAEVTSPQVEEETAAKAPPPRPAPPPAGKQPPRPPVPPASPARPPAPAPAKKEAAPPPPPEEEDPWARFKQMSDQASSLAKSTAEQLKVLSETTAAKDVKDESYVAQIGGSQGTDLTAAQRQILRMQEEQKQAKADKKARKSASSKKNVVPKFDPKKEEEVERQAAELVAKIAAQRAHELGGWKPPSSSATTAEEVPPEPKEATPESPPPTPANAPEEQKEATPTDVKEESPVEEAEKEVEEAVERAESPPAAEKFGWAGFEASGGVAAAQLPTSDSDFFAQSSSFGGGVADAFGDSKPADAEEAEANGTAAHDPFAPTISAFDADPFDTRPIEEVIAEAKQRAAEGADDVENSLLRSDAASGRHSGFSSPTPEGGSPVSARPMGFEDDFKAEAAYSHTPTPLYDEDDSAPLEDFIPRFEGEGWDLMIRHPIKKKSFMSERCWKPCFVRLTPEHMLQVFNSKDDRSPILEILLQASYSLSDNVLQAYDAYGKIHTVKLQHVLYKERVGIRAGQISRLVEGHITKYGLPLEHAAQINVLAKFACLDSKHFQTFIATIEDVLFKCPAKRDTTPTYKQDEVQIHCYDEYTAHVDKFGNVSQQRARVRMFCLSFLSGSPFLEIGLNDRRREGKEIVRRKDILPMYTERWIRFEGLELHNTVDQPLWDEDQVIRLQPPDACFFEVMRFRIRPPRNREKPLSVKSIMRMAGSKIELRIDVMAAAQQQRAKGTVESTRTIPCEDIQIRFPIPEAWIYIFREERTWGVGSVHSKTRRPGKVKNIKDRLMGAVQTAENTLIEVAIGEAKYEHVHRALVWRIPRLPEKHHQAYKSHLLKCRFQLSSFDLLPEDFQSQCEVEFTMPLATISNAVVRSVSVEQHEDSDRVEKFVRYVAKCHYDLDIEYLQVNNLDNENDLGVELKKHQTAFDPDEIKAQHEGYKIAADPNRPPPADSPTSEQPQPQAAWGAAISNAPNASTAAGGFDFEAYARQGNGGAFGGAPRQDSSSEEEEDNSKFPVISIDMSSYGY